MMKQQTLMMDGSTLATIRHGWLLRFLLLACLIAHAPLLYADIVVGRVIDAETKEPLAEAEVVFSTIYDDGTCTSTLLTDTLGRFRNLMYGEHCELRVNCLGYYSAKRAFVTGINEDTLNLGDIALRPSEIMLQAVEVKARAKRFTMRGDTVVFNPEAFNLAEDARLVDLIAKLPGVTEKEGKLYWMDKPVRIMMNGEDLFADNSLFVNRLPVEAVSKIKAYNKASRMKEKTGKDDGAEDHVLDIEVKPSFLDKWYGSLAGTCQTPKHYLARFDGMYLSNFNPMMAYFNWNNLNEILMQKGYGGSSRSISFPYGKQIFGAYGYKHQWERWQGKKKLDNYIAVSANLGHTDEWGARHKTHETFCPDEEKVRTFSLNDTRNHQHSIAPNVGLQAIIDLDSMTCLFVDANWKYSRKDARQTSFSATFDTNPYDFSDRPLDDAFASGDRFTTRSRFEDSCNEKTMAGDIMTMCRTFFRDKSMLVVQSRLSFHDCTIRQYTDREIVYRNQESPSSLDERMYRNMPSHSFSVSLATSYSRWLGKNVMGKIDYSFAYNNRAERDMQYLLSALPDYNPALPVPGDMLETVFDAADSYRSRTRTNNHSVFVGATVNAGPLSLQPAVNVSLTHERLSYLRGALDTTAVRRDFLCSPKMTVRWKLGKGSSFEGNYTYRTNTPRLLNTLDYTDSNDPLHIISGNPRLRRSYTHNAGLRYVGNFVKRQQSVLASLGYVSNIHPLVSLFSYDAATGVYHQTWANTRSDRFLNASFTYEQAIGDYVRVRNMIGAQHGMQHGYLTRSQVTDEPQLNRIRNIVLEERPEVNYENTKFYIGIKGRYILQNHHNSLAPNNRLTDYSANFETRYKLGTWTFGTTLNLEGNDGYAIGDMNKLRPIWGAKIDRKVLKNRGLVTLIANDILNKAAYYASQITAYDRIEERLETMHHYVMLSFSYNFEAKSKK